MLSQGTFTADFTGSSTGDFPALNGEGPMAPVELHAGL